MDESNKEFLEESPGKNLKQSLEKILVKTLKKKLSKVSVEELKKIGKLMEESIAEFRE